MNTPAVLFDLDGVLTDTAELHYQSWQALADEIGVPFDRQANEALRGLGRAESLAILLASHAPRFDAEQKQALMRRKNDDYLRRVAQMTAADLLPGALPLLTELRARGVRAAVASSSKNARVVVERLGIDRLLHAIVDGNDAPRSKPDPQVFELAAARLEAASSDCIVVEDAASGVDAGLCAAMFVIGVGPSERVGRAARVVGSTAALRAADMLAWHADWRAKQAYAVRAP